MISRSAAYAIRALTWMALRDAWTLNREVAGELQLPPQFLTKILRILTSRGILLSQRGKAGGFRLARPAEQITLLDIVDPFDRVLERRSCILGHVLCSSGNPCALHEEWKDVSDRLVKSLRNRTVADVARELSRDGLSAMKDRLGFPAGG